MNEPQAHIFEFGDFRVDTAKRLFLGCDGESISLTPKVFQTLLYLVQHGGRVIDKDELMEAIWPDTVVEENNLNQNISTLRRVLGENRGEHRYIATVSGRGYRFVPEVRTRTGEDTEREAAQEAERQPDEEKPTVAHISAAPQLNHRPATQQRTVWLALLAGIILLGLGGAAFYFWRTPVKPASVSSIKTIAVLPFKPLVAENHDESLEMGMADTLIARLSYSREIVVRPLGSVRKYGDLQQDPLGAGRELNVESVLDGSIQRWGDHVRVNVRLVSVADGASLWVGTFDEKFTNIFAVQDVISEKVAKALALKLSSEEKQRLTKRYTENAEAYELYLKGRYYWGKITRSETRKSIQCFQQAIDVDPDYALAYAGLSDAYRTLPIAHDTPSKDAFPQAKAAAMKALEIDESLAEAHVSLGFIKFWFDWDWDGAESEFKRAIELNPNEAYAHVSYAHLLSNLGRHHEALAEAKRARELDPLSLRINALEAQFLLYAGRSDEALARTNKMFEIDPNFWVAHNWLGRIYLQKQMYAEALAAFNKAKELSDSTEPIPQIGYAQAVSGQREQARVTLEELRQLSNKENVPAYFFALIYNGLGERDEALKWLEKSYQEREVQLTFTKVDTRWNEFRSDARFAALIKRMNLE
ncbi:MAG: winged helix-turn-helix domain-containing protein [Pyrinomonadaceae bacterium]|nr:winged helix-turn-helix domain-containing protein [Pyrinomonadaceae bacterium]